jgi:hypothetical protein
MSVYVCACVCMSDVGCVRARTRLETVHRWKYHNLPNNKQNSESTFASGRVQFAEEGKEKEEESCLPSVWKSERERGVKVLLQRTA